MIDGARTFLLLRHLRRGDRRSAAELRHLQGRLLHTAVAHAQRHVPFYRRAWAEAGVEPDAVRAIDDLGRLPIVTSAQVRVAVESGDLLATDARGPSRRFSTSGCSGEPLQLLRGAVEERLWRAGGMRILFAHGFTWRDSVLQFDPPTHRPHPLQRLGLARSAWVSPELPLDEQVAKLAASRAAFIVGTPTLLRRACRGLEQHRMAPPRVRGIICQGEILDPESRATIRRVLGADPVSVYGMTEVGYVAWQCESRQALHLNAELVAVEILDDQGRAAAPGELGRVVVTDLRGRTMPMLRWDTGDLAAAAAATPCPCGRTLARLGSVEGRRRQTIHLEGGRLVTPRAVLDEIGGILSVDEYRLHQETERRFALTLRPGTAASPAAARAQGALRRLLGGAEIRIEIATPAIGVEKTHVVSRACAA